ncbi:MAG: exodeoxyribonuclease VII large subunit [Myxococcota bacterium]
MNRYSVSGLIAEVDEVLAGRYPQVLVEAEVRGLTVSPAGHAFLTLTDGKANLQAVAWRTTWQSLRHRPQEGERALIRGRLSIYAQRGAFQLYIKDAQPAGLGDLARQIEARKLRLAADGLLDERRKRALPTAPLVVGVATSSRGAALQDFLRVSGERFPATRILVAHCTVQGPQAPSEILRAIELLVEQGESQVIVVTRGGGSQQDLLAFQDEQLARFIADVPVPVVSAVGHEVDTTIADLVADLAVPTPTAAAVHVLPDGPALIRSVSESEIRLDSALRRFVGARRDRTTELRSRLRHPSRRIADVRKAAAAAQTRLDRSMARELQDRRARLRSVQARLEALSPRAVLGRGYAVVRGPQGIISDASQVVAGQDLDVEVAVGRFGVSVRP